jgi:hypothetical protein
MKKLTRIAFTASVISVLSCLPSMAQGTFKATFTTTFSFFAGSAKLPPGTYTLRQSQDEQNVYNLQNSSGTHSVMIEGRQSTKTTSGAPQVLFNKYGTTDYLEGVETSTGNSVDLDTGIAEKIAAKNGSPQSHTVPGK